MAGRRESAGRRGGGPGVRYRDEQGPEAAAPRAPLTVGIVLANNFTLSAFSLFIDTLRLAADESDRSRQIGCRWFVMHHRAEPVRSSCGVLVNPTSGFVNPRSLDYVVVIGGVLHAGPQAETATIEYLRAAARAGTTLVGVCTGSFVLCRAGLMEGRRVCVNWMHCQDFAEAFPDIEVVADRLFVEDRGRITCAGGAGSAHLATHLVTRHLGRAAAQKSHQVLLFGQALEGSEAQPHPPLALSVPNLRVRRTLLLMEQNLSDPLSIEDIAARLGMSARQLERLFQSVLGRKPASAYRELRLRYADWLLGTSDRSLTEIALEAGFADSAHFSRQFKAARGCNPSVARGRTRAARVRMSGVSGMATPAADPGAFGAPPLWDAARDEILVCRQVRDETPDVRSFVFAAPEPRLFRFAPGQFLTFTFGIDGEEVHRCYTIASPPTRPDCVAITVKRKPGGRVSPWLHAALRPGMTVRAAGPMGDFTLRQAVDGKYLFLSAGSGITPLMSMVRTLDDLGSDADVVFVHSARTPADIIFSRELALLAAHRGGFRAALHCTSDRSVEPWGTEPWLGLRGRLDAAMLRLTAPDFLEREVFACGPAGYMEGVRATLQAAGFDLARYHQESFDFTDPATEPPGSAAEAGPAADAFQVTLSRSELTLSCGGDTTILEASRQAGLRLPSSCTRGVCGTCKSRLVSGTVDMHHGGGIRPREIAQGLILICCSRPTSDVTIER